jgi:hypothetical protein
MPVTWRISDGLVYIVSDEQAVLADWQLAVASALASGDYREGMPFLHDARLMRRVPDANELRARVRFGIASARAHSIGKWATVVASPALFGMGRMAEALSDADPAVTYRIFKDFKDLDEAEAWLREGPPLR